MTGSANGEYPAVAPIGATTTLDRCDPDPLPGEAGIVAPSPGFTSTLRGSFLYTADEKI